MARKTKVRALEMVRRIRDKHAHMLRAKSAAEIIAFFKHAGETVRGPAGAPKASPTPPKRLVRRASGRAASARR